MLFDNSLWGERKQSVYVHLKVLLRRFLIPYATPIIKQVIHSDWFGVSWKALDWFKSYLTGRSQRIKLGNCLSSKSDLSFGVPQVSVLGPLLFRVCITRVACQHFRCPVWQARGSAAVIIKDHLFRPVLQTGLPTEGLATIRGRRDSLWKSFAKSSLKNPDFQHWFPKERGRCQSYHLRKNHQRTVPFNRTKGSIKA